MELRNNRLTTFYIVRHGETDMHAKGMLHGHTDTPLTSKGEEQAQRLATELSQITFDETFSSDLVRAKRTAEILALEKELIIKTTAILRERNFGVFEGTKIENFQALYDRWEHLSEEQRWTKKFSNEESHEESVMRLVTFLRETAIAYAGKNILVVSHGSLMRSFLIKLGYGNWHTVGRFEHCGYIVVETDGVEFYFRMARGIKTWTDVDTPPHATTL